MRSIITKEIRLADGEGIDAGDTVLFRAPLPGTVVAVHGSRSGGTGLVVNAKVGTSTVLASNLTCGNGVFASAAPASAAAGDIDEGDIVSVTVVSGNATAALLQVDIAVDADTSI